MALRTTPRSGTRQASQTPATTTRSDHRTNRRAWTVVALLVVFQIIAFADKAVLGLVAPDAMSELGLTPTQFGFIGSAFFFLYSIVSILTGVIASRVSVHWIVLTLGIVTAVGGGIVRDVLMGALPPATFVDWRYLAVAAGGALLAFLFSVQLRRLRISIHLLDAAGGLRLALS